MVRAPRSQTNPSPWPRYIIGALAFLAGPGVAVAYGVYLWQDLGRTPERALAEVVAIEEYSGSNYSRSYCPVFRWTKNGQQLEAESGYCPNSDTAYAIGQSLPIRYDPSDLRAVTPDNFWQAHDELPHLAVLTALFSFVAFFMLRPEKQRRES